MRTKLYQSRALCLISQPLFMLVITVKAQRMRVSSWLVLISLCFLSVILNACSGRVGAQAGGTAPEARSTTPPTPTPTQWATAIYEILHESNILTDAAPNFNAEILQQQTQFAADSTVSASLVLLNNGVIEYYNGESWEQLNHPGGIITQMNSDLTTVGAPQIVLGYDNGTVMQYLNSNWQMLHDDTWGNLITQMATKFESSGVTQVVTGFKNGSLWYYSSSNIGTPWQILKFPDQYASPIYAMAANLNTIGSPLVVVGLQNTAIKCLNPDGRIQDLQNQYQMAGLNPVLAADLSNINNLHLVVGDSLGNLRYYTGDCSLNSSAWASIQSVPGAAITQLAAEFSHPDKPRIVIGDASGQVVYYHDTKVVDILSMPARVTSIVNLQANFDTTTPHIIITDVIGQVYYYNGSSWNSLLNAAYGPLITLNIGKWPADTPPALVVGATNNVVAYAQPTFTTVSPSPMPTLAPLPRPLVFGYAGVSYDQLGNPPGFSNYPRAYFPTYVTTTASAKLKIAYGRNSDIQVANLTALVTMGGGFCSATPVWYDPVLNSTFLIGAAHCFESDKKAVAGQLLASDILPLNILGITQTGPGQWASYPVQAVYLRQDYCNGETYSAGGCPQFNGNYRHDLAIIQISGKYADPKLYPQIESAAKYPQPGGMAPILSIGYGGYTQTPLDDVTAAPGGSLFYVANYFYQYSADSGFYYLHNSYYNNGAFNQSGYTTLVCGGDSGGGDLFWTGKHWILLAEHTYMSGQCGSFYSYLPNGSTNVSSYYAWIESIIQNKSAAGSIEDCSSGVIPNCVTNA